MTRDADDGLVQLWRFRWAIGGLLALVLVAIGIVFIFMLSRSLQPKTLGSGRREIAAMKADPVLAFRAPGTTLLAQAEHPAQTFALEGGTSSSSISQKFEMTSEPGDTVEAYRQAAVAAGWTFAADGCSRADRATAALFHKTVAGFDATLVVRGSFDQTAGIAGQIAGQRGFFVTMAADGPSAGSAADAAHLALDVGLYRNDVQCLRQLNLADPDLQPAKAPLLSLAELCSVVPVGAAKAMIPQVDHVEAQVTGDGQCAWVDGSAQRRPLFLITQARRPRAYYDDRHLPSPQTSDQVFLFSESGRAYPDGQQAAWVSTPRGPFAVAAGGALGSSVPGQSDADLLFAVARSLTAQPNPHTVPAPGLELITYTVDGGIAGTMRLTLTRDGHATYDGPAPRPIQFEVPSATMQELLGALAPVDFANLSASYGSGSGADVQSEIITYQAKTVRIRSNGPPELRPVTTILNRLLTEARSRNVVGDLDVVIGDPLLQC